MADSSSASPILDPACLFKNLFEMAIRARQARERNLTDTLEHDPGRDPDQSLGPTISVVKASRRHSRQSDNLLCQKIGSGSKPVQVGDKDADDSLNRNVLSRKHQNSRTLAQFEWWGAPIAVSITATEVHAGEADSKLRWMAQEVALPSVANLFGLSTELVEANIASYLVRTGCASMRRLFGVHVKFADQQKPGGGMGQGSSGVTITTMGGKTIEQDQSKTNLAHNIQMATHAQHEILIPTACAAMVGFASGATTSAKLSGYQFMVENLHRIPKTRSDWYFFQKTKNYKMILGGFRGGLKVGAKLGAWTAAFCSLKEGLSISPFLEDRKSVAGALSGFGIALGAGLFYRLRPLLSPRRLLLGGSLGLCAGAAEEVKALLVKDQPSL